METDSGTNADTATDSAGSLDNAFNSAGDFLHDHGPYALMSPRQQQTAQDTVGWAVDGNRAVTAPTATQSTAAAQPASTAAPAPSVPASTSSPWPAPSNEQLGYASLICGYTAKDAPRQIDDFGLARHFGLSPNIIAARSDGFYRRWVIKDSRAALDGCTVLPHMILQQPHIAPQLSPDIWSLKTAENLFSDAGHILKEVEGGIFEPGLHMATGFGAKILSDVFGLAVTAYDAKNGTEDAGRAERFRQDVRNSLTYEPRTEAGASVYNPQNLIPAWFGKLLDLTLPKAPEDASTAGGMFTNGIREGIPQLLNIAGAKYIPLVPKAMRGEPLPVKRPAAPEAPAPRAETHAPKEPGAFEPDTAPAETPQRRNPAAPESEAGETETPRPTEPAAAEPGHGEAPATDSGAPEASQPEESSSPEPQAIPPETARQAVLDFARTAQLAKILQGTRLCRENPALCSQVVQEMAAQGDMHTLYVPKEAFEQMAQSRGTTSDALLSRMTETQANGGLLAIPSHEYFTALPEGMASDLSPLAKTNPTGSSLTEVVGQARKVEGKTAETTGNGGPTKPQSWADTHPPLPPEQVKVPGGGLRAHEALGGHALEKHVGKTEQELLSRLNKEKISGSSSFNDESVAEKVIAETIMANDEKIKAWLSTNKPIEKFEATMNEAVGIKIDKGSTVAKPAWGVRIYLIRDPLSPLGYYIRTGHPI